MTFLNPTRSFHKNTNPPAAEVSSWSISCCLNPNLIVFTDMDGFGFARVFLTA